MAPQVRGLMTSCCGICRPGDFRSRTARGEQQKHATGNAAEARSQNGAETRRPAERRSRPDEHNPAASFPPLPGPGQ